MLKKLLLFALLLGAPALAQNVQQSGTVTRNHVPVWISSGVVGDGGSSADSPISSFGVTNNGGQGFCVNSARQSSAGYNAFCFGASTTSPATISLQNFGNATAQGIQFIVNGVTQGFPTVNAPVTVNDLACFASTGGNLKGCGSTTGAGISILAFGAVADGVTDAGPAINTCIAAGNDCVVPPSTNGFFINTTIQDIGSLRGTVVNFNNPSSASPVNISSFAGSSWLLCSASVSPCVRVGTTSRPNLNISAQFSNVIVSRVIGAPTAGVIGVQWNGGYNAHSENVYAFNHDTCYRWFSSSGSGIAFVGYNIQEAACKSHYMVFDGWPEAHFIGGRAGANGTADYAATDFALFTNTSCSIAGCGPNTITFQNYQVNTGNSIGCALNWANFTNFPTITEYRFTDVHIEWHTSGGTAVICSDATVSNIEQLFMSHIETSLGSANVSLFSLNSLTALQQVFIHDSALTGCTDITLAPAPASGPAFNDVHFTNIFGCNSASFTSNGTGANNLYSTANNWNTFTVAGSWNRFSSMGDVYGTLTDTSTGNVAWLNATPQSWTPVVNFGGATTGITYGTQNGRFSRTSDGGWTAAFHIILTSAGSATGAITITGIPLQCATGVDDGASGVTFGRITSMSSLTTPLVGAISTADNKTIALYSLGATGITALSEGAGPAPFTNTAEISGTVKCAKAL